MRVNHFFYFLVLALIGLIYFPRISDFGMFMDGSIYGTIAHNMAIGDGGFWRPMFHNFHALQVKGSAVFYEHPPLMFWMESWFFQLFGDGFYVEKIYATVILVLHIITLTFFFRTLTGKKYSIFAAWPVLFLWYASPTILWSFSQNMIDNTLSLLGLLSVWTAYKAIRRDHFLWAILSGLLIGLAVLTKGPMGFFPLTAIALLWLASRLTRPKGSYSFYRAFYKTVAVIGGFGIVALNVYVTPAAKEFMTRYFYQQVIASVTGQREKKNTWAEHLSIVQDMIIEYSPIYGVAILLWLFFRFSRKEKSNIKNRTFALWMIFVGLSATLPIILSAKSHSFYLISGAPYFALAVGLYWIEDIVSLVQKVNLTPRKKIIWVGFIALVVGYTAISTTQRWGDYRRDRDVLLDIEHLSEIVNPMSTIGISPDLKQHATFNSNLERHYLIYTNPNWENERIVLAKNPVDSAYVEMLTLKGYKKNNGSWKTLAVFEKSIKE